MTLNMLRRIMGSWRCDCGVSRPASAGLQALYQGLTLVHFSAQLEPLLTHENTRHTLNTP
jgi:hypothetical protein